MPKRSRSSGRWLQEHHRDNFVHQARVEGWRSRAVYKLGEICQTDKLLRKNMAVVDLGAAPGGWSQYLARELQSEANIIALDILAMEPIAGVTFIQGDFREESVLEQLEAALAGQPLDLVLSDMAPNMSGVSQIDQPRSYYLCELALEFACRWLKPEGAFLVKVFQGAGSDQYLQALRTHFKQVSVRKPDASRDRSREFYLLARGLKNPHFQKSEN